MNRFKSTSMKIAEIFRLMMSDKFIDIYKVDREDAWQIIDQMKQNNSIPMWKITINIEPGKTLFERIEP